MLDTAVARTERQRRLEAAAARKAAADEAAPVLDAHAARLSRHRQAEVLTGQLQAVEKAEAQLRSAAAARESALTLLRMAADEDPELEWLDPDAPDAAPELSRLRSLLAVVEARLPDEERLLALTARRADLGRKKEELQVTEVDLGGRLEALRAEYTDLSAGLEPLAELAAAAVMHTKEAAAADELLDVVRRYRTAVAAQQLASEHYEACREDQLQKKRRWLDLREERLANAAAELAAQLADDVPCPVCGSPDHPSPAKAAQSALLLGEAEEEAREEFEAAEARLSALGTELAAAKQLVAVLAGQGGDTPEDIAREAADEARRAAERSAQAADKLAGMRLRLTGIETRIAEAETGRSGAGAELAQVESTLAEVLDQATALSESLSGLRSGHRDLTHRLRALKDAAGTLEKTVQAQTQLDQAGAPGGRRQAAAGPGPAGSGLRYGRRGPGRAAGRCRGRLAAGHRPRRARRTSEGGRALCV